MIEIETLAALSPGDMITVDHAGVQEFTEQDDFVVKSTDMFNFEDGDVVLMDLGDFYLIANNLSGDCRFAICEVYDSGSHYFNSKRQEFEDHIELNGGEDGSSYELSYVAYSGHDDDGASFAEYISADAYYDAMVIQKVNDEVIVYRGLEVGEDNIIL